ncbi:hypothetical protein WDU94_007648 [Cyamophila willieti]
MKVSVNLPNLNSFTINLNSSSTLRDLKHLAQPETGLEAKDMIFTHNGVCLTNDERILKDLGVKDGDMVTVHKQEDDTDGNEQMETCASSKSDIQTSPNLLQEQTGLSKKCEDSTTALQEKILLSCKHETKQSPANIMDLLKKQTSTFGHMWKDGIRQFISPLRRQRKLQATGYNENHSVGKQLDLGVYMMKNNIHPSRHFHASIASRNAHDPIDNLYTSSFRQGHSYVIAPAAHKFFPDPQFKDPQFKDPAYVRELLLSCPDQLSLMRQNNPDLSRALDSQRMDFFARAFKTQIAKREKKMRHRLKLLNSELYDQHTQKQIAEEIQKRNIEANMEAAIEYNPEAFGTVAMLYINCKVNGFPVKAFVDSGAQTTIMSTECARRCNIIRLVDTRWEGIAKGVGVQRIIGRIHMVQIVIEKDHYTTSLSILNEQPMDMLLGLDMLKRHRCIIDLKRNVLHMGTTGTVTPFLSEADLPECARLTSVSDDEESYML